MQMLNVAVDIFNTNQSSTSKPSANVSISKLLIILSDGRGVFYEGIDRVKAAVQHALSQGIFIIFVILDITDKNWSIFDIKMQVNTPGSPVKKRNLNISHVLWSFYYSHCVFCFIQGSCNKVIYGEFSVSILRGAQRDQLSAFDYDRGTQTVVWNGLENRQLTLTFILLFHCSLFLLLL